MLPISSLIKDYFNFDFRNKKKVNVLKTKNIYIWKIFFRDLKTSLKVLQVFTTNTYINFEMPEIELKMSLAN